MSITVSGNLAAALNTGQLPQSNAVRSGASFVDFKQFLSTAGLKGFGEEIAKKYGLSVGLQAIPKNEQEIVRRGRSGSLNDIMIAPGIAEKMENDPSLRAKVEGYIDDYVHNDLPSFERMENMYGVTCVASSLIIHEDGTRTVWSASVTSPEEVEKGKKIEAAKQKEKQEVQARWKAARAKEELHSADTSMPSLLTVPQSPSIDTLYEGWMSSQEWMQRRSQIQFKFNSLPDLI